MMGLDKNGGPPKEAPAEGPAATQDRTHGSAASETDAILGTLHMYQAAAREIADSDIPFKAKCIRLIELHRLARKEVLPAFAEAAVWGAVRHLFEPTPVPNDIIEAMRGMRRAGLTSCPTCRRDLPTHDELDRWLHLRRESMFRRPA